MMIILRRLKYICLIVAFVIYKLFGSWRKYSRRDRYLSRYILVAAPRTGKSTLARMVRQQLGGSSIDIDRINPFLQRGLPERYHASAYCSIVRLVLFLGPPGLTVEGSGFLTIGTPMFGRNASGDPYFLHIARNTVLTSDEKKSRIRHDSVSPHSQLVLNELTGTGVPVIALIGESDEQELYASVLEHREFGQCWTSALCSDDEVNYLVIQAIALSQKLAMLCDVLNIHPIYIRSQYFKSDLEYAVTYISEKILASRLSEN